MQLRGAISSHVGNVRENNQDRAHFGGYVAAVADGMGGHQGGEMAASIAITEFLSIDQPIEGGGLVALVQAANAAVFERASDPDLRGMGTTLVALTLRPGEHRVSIVNVGDSRAYFLRAGSLRQLTLDHSLVEDLVRQKRLTKEEALNHPQRNILTRALGIASQVEVDQFLEDVQLGDRFLLCSDGLFNEVDEVDIAAILSRYAAPNEAADALVNAALAGAARDNVTVAVVDVVNDGDGADLTSRPAETLLVPSVATTTGELDVTAVAAIAESARVTQPAPVMAPAAAPNHGPGTSNGPVHGSGGGDILESPGPEPQGGMSIDMTDPRLSALELDRMNDSGYATAELPRVVIHEPERGRLGPMVAIVGMLVLLAGIVYLGVSIVGKRGFFVGVDDSSEVAIFQGRPGGFLWIQPLELADTGLPVSDLEDKDRNLVESNQQFGSAEEAEAFVEQLRSGADGADEPADDADRAPTTTSTTTASSASTTTTVAGAASTSGDGTNGPVEGTGAADDEAGAGLGAAAANAAGTTSTTGP